MRSLKIVAISLILLQGFGLFGQDCPVKNKLRPDGSIVYFMDPILFFNTKDYQIYGSVMTDKESYFLMINPHPLPPKSQGNKMNQDILITLDNQKEFNLKHFDSQYVNDTTFIILYLVSKEALPEFREQDIESVKLNTGTDKGSQTFQFRLHKGALKEQLTCLSGKKN